MPEQTKVVNHGLVTQYNPLSSTEGGLATANDCVIRRERVVETRRGYASYATTSSSPSQLLVYDTKVLTHQGTTLSYDNGSGTLYDYSGSYTAPTGAKINGAEANQNLYFTTSTGVRVVSDTYATRSVTGDTTNGSNQVTSVSATTNIKAGNTITGTGIPANTTVTGVSGTTLTLSANATATNSTVALTIKSASRGAGAPRALDPSYVLATPVGTGFLTTAYQTAYRVVITRTDQNQNLMTGYPSQRLWVINTSGATKDVTLTIYLPTDALVGDVVEVYRTTIVSGTTTDTAGDEMYLVYSFTLTANELPTGTTGYLAVTDVVLDALAQTNVKLYTSPSQEGIAQGNEAPPLAKDIALYKSDFLFFANTQTKQRLFFNLVGTSKLGKTSTGDTTNTSTTVANVNTTNLEAGMQVSGTGIPAATTISSVGATSIVLSAAATATNVGTTLTFITSRTYTLAGTTYSFAATESSSTGVVAVGVTGVAANDIDTTARSMCRVANRYATNTTVYAYYLTSPSTLPGQILIEERSVGGSAFTMQVSNAQISTMFDPIAPVSTATSTAMTSSNDVRTNGLYYSKAQEMEHVPGVNYFPVGPANKDILRIVALRDSLIIIKEEGIYRLTGDSPGNFDVIKMDDTVFCKAAESVRVLSNNVFMLANQGVVAVSDTGVRVVSREIEPNIVPLLTFTNISTLAYGFAYESERSYFLSVPQSDSETTSSQIYVYNVFTKAWSRWTFGVTCAVVEQNGDRLYLCKADISKIYRERKSFTSADYSDPEISITFTSVDTATDTVVFTINGATPTVGWTLKQGDTEIAISTLQEGATPSWTAVLADDIPASWTTGAATAYPKIPMEFVWLPWDAGDAGMMKQVSQVSLLLDNLSGNTQATGVTLTFFSDLDLATTEVDVAFTGQGWGDAWGDMPWGGSVETYAYPTYTPRNSQYCRIMNLGAKQKNANEKLSVNGVSYKFYPVSERTNK